MDPAYYNEVDPYAAQWLRNLISEGLIPPGEVDERSIVDVQPGDLAGYRQCHFFAGIGGWALAARLTGWPDDRELWTGSAPCQPFSVAGQGKAQADDRHLWPHLFRLASARRPAVLMGEQVAAAVGKNWLDGVFADLEGIGYACGAAVVPACAVDAPHRRDRLWFVAHVAGEGRGQAGLSLAGDRPADRAGAGNRTGDAGAAGNGAGTGADADGIGGQVDPHAGGSAHRGGAGQVAGPSGAWDGAGWILGHDGKARRVGARVRRVADGLPAGMAGLCSSGDAAQGEFEMIPLLAHGVPARVGKLRAFGNAIVPQLAAEVIGAYMDVRP